MMFRPVAYLLTILLFQTVAFGQLWDPIEAEATARLATIQTRIKPIYRKPSRVELKSVEPDISLAEKYAEFLKRPDTGLTKLIADKACGDAKVISASDDCLKYSLPGGGSSFSFREGAYRLARLADVTFTDNSFQASGSLVLGVFAKIGDVPLSEVDLKSKGMRYLLDMQPESDYTRARQFSELLTSGVNADGFLYRRGLYAVDKETYVLRSVAYGGKHFRSAFGVTYNEFDFDRRTDVIVAFRVVDRDADGNVTILWKKLQEKEAPKVNWEKGTVNSK